jgi:succinate dehydrogenase / fumarate reductase iron-sulfur subunit/fumarate reductase iron-sulfur subunit
MVAERAVATPDSTLEVRIARTDPAARAVFTVPTHEAWTVLDLVALAANEDPTLAYRYSCRSGFCGTCTLLVDGRPVLSCQTPVPDQPVVHLAPLGGLPVVRDLVVDPTPFAERWDVIAPAIDDGDGAVADALPRPLGSAYGAAGAVAADSLDCISCGACFAACDMASLDSVFLGPAALNRAMVTIADPRAPERAARLAIVAGRSGVDGCHGIGACSLACPRDLDPQRAIRRLRRWRVIGLA